MRRLLRRDRVVRCRRRDQTRAVRTACRASIARSSASIARGDAAKATPPSAARRPAPTAAAMPTECAALERSRTPAALEAKPVRTAQRRARGASARSARDRRRPVARPIAAAAATREARAAAARRIRCAATTAPHVKTAWRAAVSATTRGNTARSCRRGGLTTCPAGCCDSNGACQGGNLDIACGDGGQACEDCTASGPRLRGAGLLLPGHPLWPRQLRGLLHAERRVPQRNGLGELRAVRCGMRQLSRQGRNVSGRCVLERADLPGRLRRLQPGRADPSAVRLDRVLRGQPARSGGRV